MVVVLAYTVRTLVDIHNLHILPVLPVQYKHGDTHDVHC